MSRIIYALEDGRIKEYTITKVGRSYWWINDHTRLNLEYSTLEFKCGGDFYTLSHHVYLSREDAIADSYRRAMVLAISRIFKHHCYYYIEFMEKLSRESLEVIYRDLSNKFPSLPPLESFKVN